MSSTLPDFIISDIQAHINPDQLVAAFGAQYLSLQYPPIDVFKTLFLCSAIEHDHSELVDLLLSSGYYVNYTFGYVAPSPIHVAVSVGRADYIQKLLDAGASVNLESHSGHMVWEAYSAVEFCCVKDSVEILRMLLPRYNKEETRTKRTPLHLACLHGAYSCLEYLLSIEGGSADIDALDSDDRHHPDGLTPLMLAVQQGAHAVRMLLSHGASVAHITARLCRTVLHLAVLHRGYHYTPRFVPQDLPETLRLLLGAGCDVNALEASGDTALSLLCTQPKCLLRATRNIVHLYDVETHRSIVVESAAILLESGADPNLDPRSLPLAVLSDHASQMLAQLLHVLDASSDVENTAVHTETVAEVFVLTRDLMEVLLRHGANPNINGTRDDTRLIKTTLRNLDIMLAAQARRSINEEYCDKLLSIVTDILRLLYLCGAQVVISDGSDALHLSAMLVVPLDFVATRCREVLMNILDDAQLADAELLLRKSLRLGMSEIRGYPFDESMLSLLASRKPNRLKHFSRLAIIRALSGHRCLKNASKLGLPPRLEAYVLSMQD